MMRRTASAFLVICVSTGLLSAIALADEPLTLRVGAYENPLKIYTDERGAILGFWPDLVEAIAAQEGWQIEWVHGTWPECLERLERSEIDILPDTGYTEPRAELYAFSNETVLLSWSRVYAHRGAGIDSILDLEGKTVGALAGSFNLHGPGGIREIVAGFEIDCTFVEMDTYAKVFEALERGSLDAGVTNKDFGNAHEGLYDIEKTPIVFQPARMQFAFTKDSALTPYLIEAIDRSIKAQKQDNRSAYYRALEEHLGVVPQVRTELAIPQWVRNVLLGAGVAVVFFLGAILWSRREVKRRTNALRASEERFRDLYENAPNACFSVDGNGAIRACNRRAGELLGYACEEIIGRPVLDLYADTPQGKAKAKVVRERFLAGDVVRDEELQMRRADGTTVWISLTVNAVRDAKGEVVESRSMAVDISERKQEEGEKLVLEAQLRQAQKLEAIGTLASGVAHEINNPLMGMINYADMIANEAEDAGVKEYSQVIIKEGNRIAVIVRNLLSFARQEKEAHSPASIIDIIDSSLSLVGSLLRKDQIAMELDIPDDLPQVKCRSQRIQQVVVNLLTNAHDALNKRYPSFDENKVIRITVRPFEKNAAAWVRTTVEDHGTGVPEDKAKRIFDPFFTTKPRDAGSGLGLSVSFGIVREHRGELTVESMPGEYTRFHIDLPVDNGWTHTENQEASP